MKTISLETTIGEILGSPVKAEVCKRAGGDFLNNPMLASAETMTLRRVCELIGADGAKKIADMMEKANAVLPTLSDEGEGQSKNAQEISSAVPLSSLQTEEERNSHIRTNNCIRPGQVWYDTAGNRIQAHGACVYFEKGTYYWIGENKDYTRKEGRIWTWGIKIYSSRDLYNWKDEGYLIEPELMDKDSIFYPIRRLDRPHILYNERTKKYVLWLKYCDEAHFSVMTSDSLHGKYELIKEVYRPFDVHCGDFDLAKDERTGQGYLYWEVNHTDVWGVRLDESYTQTDGEPVVIYKDKKPPFAREAVTHMFRKGKHYLFTSGMTGYVPNPSEVAVSDDWLEGYSVQGNPHVNDASRASFNSQISCIFQISGQDRFVAVADRWVPEFVMTAEKYDVIVRAITSREDPSVRVTAEEKKSLLDMPMMGTANTSIADYVWLPIKFEGDVAKIYWRDEWALEERK